MTPDDPKLERFYDAVVYALDRTYTRWHLPDPECYVNRCRWSSKQCDWTEIRDIVRAFWKDAPDVNRRWKREAKRLRFDVDAFHELLLGIFIAGDEGSSRSFNTRFFGNPKDVSMSVSTKPLRVQNPKTP